MTDHEPYSRRQEALARVGQPIAYEYDRLPREFRVQVFQILDDIIGQTRKTMGWLAKYDGDAFTPDKVWDAIHDLIARERGVFNLHDLTDDYGNQILEKKEQLQNYLVYNEEVPTLHQLDAVEISFRSLEKITDVIAGYQDQFVSRQTPRQGIEELNQRFRQHGLGYAFDMDGGRIVRVDSEYLHAEAVTAALHLLRRTEFSGAETEFVRAQEHYRHGRHEEAIADALKAFESTMKYICDQCQWGYDPNRDTVSRLIDIMLQNELIPQWAQAEFAALRSILESGLPTARNRIAGHGRGAIPRQIPGYLAAFALHMAAANIVLLGEAFNELPPLAGP